jgi:hypothetical protein
MGVAVMRLRDAMEWIEILERKQAGKLVKNETAERLAHLRASTSDLEALMMALWKEADPEYYDVMPGRGDRGAHLPFL